ncbi:MAG: four-carbon acid sugar kinase family protein [Deltaproteobacteria bacterium]
MDKIVIIADDLTGGADTGVQFCAFFDETVLVPHDRVPNALGQTGEAASRAISIFTNSRTLEADIARKRLMSLAGRFSQSKPEWIYKKIDSCLRGNLGAEIEAIMDGLGFELSFIAPAFPEMGRTTVNDIHMLHGVPVNQTEISQDPVAPVTESRLSRLVAQQSRYPVGHVALDLLQKGEVRLQNEIARLARQGTRHIVFDSTCRDHLGIISRLLTSSNRRILPVGSAGLAGSLGCVLPPGLRSTKDENRAPEGGNHLIVSGTTSAVTKRQIKELRQVSSYREIILTADQLADGDQRNTLLKKASGVAGILSADNVIIRIGSQANGRTAAGKPPRLPRAESVAGGIGIFVAAALKRCRPGFLWPFRWETPADSVPKLR